MSAVTVKARPILFSAPMIRAILDGSKSQTRRLVKPQPPEAYGALEVELFHPTVVDRNGDEHPGCPVFGAYTQDGEWGVKCPYGEPGDQLWVRETFAPVPATAYRCSTGVAQTVNPSDPYEAAIYRATFDLSAGGISWKPSIFMPRWASRITLEITDVRVERLQAISEVDAVAEGCNEVPLRDAVARYRWVWDSIHGEEVEGKSWSANPFVWVVAFRRVAA